MVPMRDGARLAMDVYMPVDANRKLGTVLERTPYGRDSQITLGFGDFSKARYFASHGFVFAAQDKRGKFGSEGVYLATANDVEDAADTLDWIADQPWSNGKVGMIGCSYPGATQLRAAQTLNPHLAALIPQAAGMATGSLGDSYLLFGRRGGTVNIGVGGWFALFGSKLYLHPPAHISEEDYRRVLAKFDPAPKAPTLLELGTPEWQRKFRQSLLELPITAIDDFFEPPPNDWDLLASLTVSDPWWERQGYLTENSRVDAPALHINGWHDYGVAESLLHFNFFRKNARSRIARENQYAIVGPAGHCNSETVSETTVMGELEVGDASFDYWGTYVRWYDRWLNGNEQALQGMPPIQYFNVGANQWRAADQWPLPNTEYRKFYLTSSGQAASRSEDGRLTVDPPQDSGRDTYVYDPAVPTSTISPTSGVDLDVWNGSFDRREIQARSDVLVYTSAPLDKPLNVTGPMKAVLYVSSSAKDTDFDVTLVDVFPDGRAMGVYEGMLRARYREGFTKEVFMEAGEVYELEIDMNVTSNTFLPGHRIRLEIASSRWPNHDRNMNTGGDNYDETEGVPAENTIHHSPEYPSHLVLPVVPD